MASPAPSKEFKVNHLPGEEEIFVKRQRRNHAAICRSSRSEKRISIYFNRE